MVLRGEAKETIMDEEGVLRIKGCVCVPRVDDLIHTIHTEAHSSGYSIHPGATKMYRDLKQHFWWSRMKRDMVDFGAKCPNFNQVKYKQQRPGGTLQRKPIPKWKWERIAMDFVVGIPKTLGKFDSIWVIVDRVTKSDHFLSVKVTYNAEKLAKIYISEIVRLHEVHLSIISDRVLLDENLSYEEEPVAILDREVPKLKSREIASIKVQWKNRPVEEATWEKEDNANQHAAQSDPTTMPTVSIGQHFQMSNTDQKSTDGCFNVDVPTTATSKPPTLDNYPNFTMT
ncbi:uncharacterized protein [Solanum lycopersicum]|uniref:uncharacterized protein n=1 Tax=Solanum lycopersicum TaxID=4081 RepID=UPI003748D172